MDFYSCTRLANMEVWNKAAGDVVHHRGCLKCQSRQMTGVVAAIFGFDIGATVGKMISV